MRIVRAVVSAAITTSAMVAIGVPTASATPLNGEPVWVPRDSSNPDSNRPVNRALAKIGTRVYVGGTFDEVAAEEGAPAARQSFVAAVDATTGQLLESFAPKVDGDVRALLAADDGSVLYAGGIFTTVNGQPLPGLALLDPVTGALKVGATQLPIQGHVDTLVKVGTTLYVGGDFTRIGDTRRVDLARFDITNPSNPVLDPSWAPVGGGEIWSISVPPDRSRVYVGGQFDHVGTTLTGMLVALDYSTGALVPSFVPNPAAKNPAFSIVALNDRVFVAYGGGYNRFVQMDLAGNAQFIVCGDGDVQELHLIGTTLLVGGHFAGNPKRKCPGGVIPTARLSWYDVSGPLPVDISPTPMPLIWANELGVWEVMGDSLNDLWLAGDFQRLGNRPVGGFAHWTNPSAYSDFANPSTPGTPTITSVSPGSITATWAASTDNRLVSGYYVYVNGVKQAVTTGTAVEAKGLDPATTYSVAVQAFDARLNLSALSSTASATTPPDITPPQAPTGLHEVNGGPSGLLIAWHAAVDDGTVRTYDVHADGVLVGSTAATQFEHDGLAAGSSHRYTVVAVDAAGNRSPDSRPLVARAFSVVLPSASTYRYWDRGSLPDINWRDAGYDDSSWGTGAAPLGYGDPGLGTTIGYGPDGANRYLTSYARTTFQLANPDGISGLTLRMKADDGAAVFVNGHLAYNDNLPASLDPDMEALTTRDGPAEEITREFRTTIPPGFLVAGTNTVAVQFTQVSSSSTDLWFDLELSAGLPPASDGVPPTAPTDLKVNDISPTAATVLWDAGTDDIGVLGYEVVVNGTPVAQTVDTSFVLTGLTPGSANGVTVRTIDWTGTRSSDAAPVVVLTSSPAVSRGSTWKYWDRGGIADPNWTAPAFDDSGWASGPAQLGYGDGDEATVISYGPSAATKYLTSYFRRTFTVANPAAVTTLNLSLIVDDGAVVYVNGTEVARYNLPATAITSTTKASANVGGAAENTPVLRTLAVTGLLQATNTIAVEVHQINQISDDLSFDLGIDVPGRWVADASVPTTPAAVSGSESSPGTIHLSWAASSDDGTVIGYRVLRDGHQIAQVPSTSFDDTGLSDGRTYNYEVVALDWAWRTSDRSVAVPVSTADRTAPTAPGTPTLTTAGPSSLAISWSAATDNVGVTQYTVWRDGNPVGTTAATSYTDSGLAEATSYSYSVSAADAATNTSAPSGAAAFSTTETQAPTVPTGLATTDRTSSTISLSWSPSTDNVSVSGYHVYRDGNLVGTTATATYADSGLAAGTTYHYTVTAFDPSANESAPSAALAATTFAPPSPVLTTSTLWSYTSTKVNLGTAWSAPGYVATAPLWSQGRSQFGFGDGDETTVIPGGATTPATAIVTWYFRTSFTVADPNAIAGLAASLIRDDGAVVYVNGVEVYRSNLPAGPLTYKTKALSSLAPSVENRPVAFTIPAGALVAGTNTVAVELHNASAGNSDASFQLTASTM